MWQALDRRRRSGALCQRLQVIRRCCHQTDVSASIKLCDQSRLPTLICLIFSRREVVSLRPIRRPVPGRAPAVSVSVALFKINQGARVKTWAISISPGTRPISAYSPIAGRSPGAAAPAHGGLGSLLISLTGPWRRWFPSELRTEVGPWLPRRGLPLGEDVGNCRPSMAVL
jgi:hypothetical protein